MLVSVSKKDVLAHQDAIMNVCLGRGESYDFPCRGTRNSDAEMKTTLCGNKNKEIKGHTLLCEPCYGIFTQAKGAETSAQTAESEPLQAAQAAEAQIIEIQEDDSITQASVCSRLCNWVSQNKWTIAAMATIGGLSLASLAIDSNETPVQAALRQCNSENGRLIFIDRSDTLSGFKYQTETLSFYGSNDTYQIDHSQNAGKSMPKYCFQAINDPNFGKNAHQASYKIAFTQNGQSKENILNLSLGKRIGIKIKPSDMSRSGIISVRGDECSMHFDERTYQEPCNFKFKQA